MKLKAILKTGMAIAYNHRTQIATITGGVLVIGGTVHVISKAREAVELVDEIEYKNMQIRRKDANEEWESTKQRSKEKRDLLKYSVIEYSKIYGPGVIAEAVGLGLIAWSDVSQTKQIGALSASVTAYAATLNSIKERVVADQGEEKWQEYLLGPQCTTVEVQADGTVVQKTDPLNNPNAGAGLPPHCIMFDESNFNWEKDPQMNKDFLENHERWLDQRLECEDFLFENDIRREIGAPLVKSGWTSGIFAYKFDPVTGDKVRNHFKFGLDAKNPRAQAFRDGYEPSIILQPNVEDNIIDQLHLPLI